MIVCLALAAVWLNIFCLPLLAFEIGIVSVSDSICLGPLGCKDTLNRDAVPDSVHVLVWHNGTGANSISYFARSTNPKSEYYIDTTTVGGHQYFYFRNVIDSIDGNKPYGVYTGGVVFYKQGQPSQNPFTFIKLATSVKNYYARLDTTIGSRTAGTPLNFGALRISGAGFISPNFGDITGEATVGAFDKSFFILNAESTSCRILLNPENKISTDVNGRMGLADGSITAEVVDPAVFSIGADSTESRHIGVNWGRVVNSSSTVNLANTKLRVVDSLIALSNGSITSAKFAANAIDSSVIKAGALTNSKFTDNAFDSLNFDNSFRVMLDNHGGGTSNWSALQRDSVLQMARAYKIDSLAIHLGKQGESTNRISLHMKLGPYSGAAGDNNNVKDDLAGLTLTGGGTEPETIIVLSLADSSAIMGAKITVRTLNQMTTRVPGLATGVDGSRIVELDPASYVIVVVANNYAQVVDTIVVTTGGGTSVILMAPFNPGNPAAPGLCRVYGWVYDIGGLSLSDIEIAAEIPGKYQPVKYDGAAVTPFDKTVLTDSTGYWSLDLLPNPILTPANSKYLFTIKCNSGVVYRIEAVVPNISSWQLQ